MNKIKLIILLISMTFQFSANANNCITCAPLTKVQNFDFSKTASIMEGRELLVDFEFSKNNEIRQQEIIQYLILASKLIEVDNMSISAEYFFNTYQIYKEEFDQNLKLIDANQRQVIIKSLNEIQDLRSNSHRQ